MHRKKLSWYPYAIWISYKVLSSLVIKIDTFSAPVSSKLNSVTDTKIVSILKVRNRNKWFLCQAVTGVFLQFLTHSDLFWMRERATS